MEIVSFFEFLLFAFVLGLTIELSLWRCATAEPLAEEQLSTTFYNLNKLK